MKNWCDTLFASLKTNSILPQYSAQRPWNPTYKVGCSTFLDPDIVPKMWTTISSLTRQLC